MNSLGDNRSSKILFGKRKYCPLQFLRIRKPPLKLFERIFYKVKTKKKTPFKKLPLLYREKFPFCSGVFQNSLRRVYILFHHNKKYPSIIQRKIQVLLMCFQKNLQIIFTQKKNPRHAGKDYQYHLYLFF